MEPLKTPEQREADAMERLHSDASGVVGPNPDDNPPWLNQLDVADRIVRQFGLGITERYGQIPQDQFMDWLKEQCRDINDLFLGYKPGEVRTDYKRGPWNTPDQLGMNICANLRFNAMTDESVRDAAMYFARDFISSLNHYEGKPVEEWGWILDADIQKLVWGLLGIDWHEEEYQDHSGDSGEDPEKIPEEPKEE